MAVWAYVCELCRDHTTNYYVPWDIVNEFPLDVSIVRVKVDRRWLCARVDRTRPAQVEGMLVRDVIATEAKSCAECEDE